MSWSPNNKAHACLSGFEIWHHKQPKTSFMASGEWGTDFMIKAVPGESPSTRASKVDAHAKLLNEAFTALYGAKPEGNLDQDDAVAQMKTALSDSGKKMRDVGDAVDAAYRFIGELA